MSDRLLVYVIAGEASGDLLGAGLMAALKQKNPAIEFAGIGGEQMMAEGLTPLFPMADLSVMGLVEVLSHLPRLISRINETVTDILAKKPAAVIGIDAPDFCFRVEKKVRAANPAIKLVHYVAPSVWAWRPGRAKKIAPFLDHLLALLPFEPPYFADVGLPCSFVGHPATTTKITGDAVAFRRDHNLSDDTQIVLLLPGSRRSEVSRLLPLCLEVARRLDRANLFFAIPTVSNVTQIVRDGLASFHLPHAVIETKADKQNAFAAARAALAASGTVALELALANVPAVICYRFAGLTGMIARRVIRVKYAALPNLIFNREIMPEFIQDRAQVELIVPALQDLMDDTPTRQVQLSATTDLVQILKPDGIDPSVRAAGIVLGLISDRSAAVEA